jgi:hydroxymethylpyrimidine/phosphomethylpyrimidine kinase
MHSLLVDYPAIPVVFDPVIASGAGSELSDRDVVDAMLSLLVPQATVITPNTPEVRRLAPEADDDASAAMSLLEHGAEYVLVTGTHARTDKVINHLYSNNRLLESFSWPRLPDNYHGSGCTLASSIAGLLAQGMEPVSAIHQAQEYTWQCLKYGYRIGMGQKVPNRLFWVRHEQDTPAT